MLLNMKEQVSMIYREPLLMVAKKTNLRNIPKTLHFKSSKKGIRRGNSRFSNAIFCSNSLQMSDY